MKNLIQKIAPLVLATAGIIGCVTTHNPTSILTEPVNPASVVSPSKVNERGIDLRNGFFAESYLVVDDINLITRIFLGETILKKTDNGYKRIRTNAYNPPEIFDNTYDGFCKTIDNGDKFLTETETEYFLSRLYYDTHKIDDWLEIEE